MFSNYTRMELYTLYLSIRNVQSNLLCDRCEGYQSIGDKSECPFAFFCQDLCVVKTKILEDLTNRGIFELMDEVDV